MRPSNTHSLLIGYLVWIFGFTGAHRFYYGRPVTGTIWFFTLGLLGVGWLVDLFLIPSMDRSADRRYQPGPYDYNIAWLLLSFLGYLGVHRMYLGKWFSGIVYLCFTLTASVIWILAPIPLLMWLYDLWTLNEQVSERNSASNWNAAPLAS